MKNLRYFVWIIIPITAYLVFLAFGLPHFRWSYSWRDDGQGYDPFATRWYTACTYIGTYGDFTIRPHNGKCAWIVFRKGNAGGVG